MTKNPPQIQQYRMMISSRHAFDKKVIHLICHRSEETGFGDALKNHHFQIGIFEIPCWTLYQTVDEELERLRDLLKEKNKEIEFLKRRPK